jgi:hypothetical protein
MYYFKVRHKMLQMTQNNKSFVCSTLCDWSPLMEETCLCLSFGWHEWHTRTSKHPLTTAIWVCASHLDEINRYRHKPNSSCYLNICTWKAPYPACLGKQRFPNFFVQKLHQKQKSTACWHLSSHVTLKTRVPRFGIVWHCNRDLTILSSKNDHRTSLQTRA